MIYTSMCTTNKGLLQLDFISRKPIELEDESSVGEISQEYDGLIRGLELVFDVKIYAIQVSRVDVNLNRTPTISW